MVKAPKAIETAMREGFHLFEWMHQRVGGSTFLATVQLTRITLQGSRGCRRPCAILPNNAGLKPGLRAYATFQRAILDNAGVCDYFFADPTASLNCLIPQRRPCSGYRRRVVASSSGHLSRSGRKCPHPLTILRGNSAAPSHQGFDVFVEKCGTDFTQ